MLFVKHVSLCKAFQIIPMVFFFSALNLFVFISLFQVVQHCVSCLGAIVNKVTHNYKFVWACFNRYYGKRLTFKTSLIVTLSEL